ncbi:MAG TPA: hypothetical protein VGX76_19625, partial [Pirellulales bacterium]|nr:hypothetical protein [Pirellulales bacterium]
MSNTSEVSEPRNFAQRPMPLWLVAGIVGVVLGGGGTFLVLNMLGFERKDTTQANNNMPEGMR